MSQRAVLIVEDDPAIRRGLADALEFAGFEPVPCDNGEEGLERALSGDLALVILDVILPGVNGLEILAEVRRCRPRLPIIMVTARGAESERVHGLRAGADDYVVKPFSATELLARVEAVLRRSAERPLDVRAVDLAGRRIDFERREIALPCGQVRQLSDRETDVLRYLAANPSRVITRAEMLQSIWGLDPRGMHTRTVDMHVARLREKLDDDPCAPAIIVTVRGKGYMMAATAKGSA